MLGPEVEDRELREAASINKSLHHLTLVIKALTARPRESHIPYRDSTLTKILSQSIGGESRVIME